LFLGEIDVGRQRRLLFGAGDDFDDLIGSALLQQFAANRRQQRGDALQKLQVLGWTLGRSGEQKDNMNFMVVKGEAVRRKAEDQFRIGEVVDSQMRHSDAFADITVTFVLFIRRMGVELRPEIGDLRAGAQLVDGTGKLALEPKDDLGAVETLGDHGAARKSLEDRRLSV
jgi:hypothetical protein